MFGRRNARRKNVGGLLDNSNVQNSFMVHLNSIYVS